MAEFGDRSVSAEDVVVVYEVLLGRRPENEGAVRSHIRSAKTARELVLNIAMSPEFRSRFPSLGGTSPFVHFNSSLPVADIVLSHEKRDRGPRDGCFVNFLGVAVPVEVMDFLKDKSGQMDHVPIPANFHADMSEWAATLRAVDLARDTFTMIELGCGWACWMNNTGAAARGRGLRVELIGVEGDEKHLDLARKALNVNGFSSSDFTLYRGVAAADGGCALFPTRSTGEMWGAEPRFGVSDSEARAAVESGNYEVLEMIPLHRAIGKRRKVDLLHLDIQGGEADLVASTLELLGERVAYVVVGTHSRALEGKLMEMFLGYGWQLEVERPAIFAINGGKPQTTVDGVQGWRNPRLT